MNAINLHALEGRTILAKLLNYFKIHADTKRRLHVTLPEPLPGTKQRGESCKLKALEIALEHASCKAKSTTPPIPLYKGRIHATSLRELAKAHGSVVGEMYTVESILKTSTAAGFAAECHTAYNEDDYIAQLEALIDRNLAPMVFFDLDLTPGERYGFPSIGDGNNEHAGVVVGYYKNEFDETHFIVTFWNHYFDFDGMELALSSCYSLLKKREPETFRKMVDTDGTTLWRLEERIPTYETALAVPLRTAAPLKDTDTPLKGKIITITGPLSAAHSLSHHISAAGTTPEDSIAVAAPAAKKAKAALHCMPAAHTRFFAHGSSAMAADLSAVKNGSAFSSRKMAGHA